MGLSLSVILAIVCGFFVYKHGTEVKKKHISIFSEELQVNLPEMTAAVAASTANMFYTKIKLGEISRCVKAVNYEPLRKNLLVSCPWDVHLQLLDKYTEKELLMRVQTIILRVRERTND